MKQIARKLLMAAIVAGALVVPAKIAIGHINDSSPQTTSIAESQFFPFHATPQFFPFH